MLLEQLDRGQRFVARRRGLGYMERPRFGLDHELVADQGQETVTRLTRTPLGPTGSRERHQLQRLGLPTCRRDGFEPVPGKLGSLSPSVWGPGYGIDFEGALTRFHGERKGRAGDGLWREEKLLPKVGILGGGP